jgi:hypothetical protein
MVLMIGRPSDESTDPAPIPYATAFVLSKRRGLLVTAAHVADELVAYGFLFATTGDARVCLRVRGAYFHPRVRRRLDKGLAAESLEPADGPVEGDTFDLAVLVLADELPEVVGECVLASEDEIGDLTGRPFGILGFPSSIKYHWPTRSESITPKLSIDRVERNLAYKTDRFENLVEDQTATIRERSWVKTPPTLGRGASGAPLFLENGHVIAVSYWSSREFWDGEYHAHQYAIRADAIRELIAHYRLLGENEGDDPQVPRVPKPGGDQRLARFRVAVDKSKLSDRKRLARKFDDAGTLSNEALALAPNYAAGYLRRAQVYLDYCRFEWARLTPTERRRYAMLASEDAERCLERLRPNVEPTAAMVYSYANLYACTAVFDPQHLSEITRGLGLLLAHDAIHDLGGPTYRAKIFNCRGHLRTLAGDSDGALADYTHAIDLDPIEPRWLRDRSNFWAARRRPDLAARDALAADRLLHDSGKEPSQTK